MREMSTSGPAPAGSVEVGSPRHFVSEAVAFEICPTPGLEWELRDDYLELIGAYSVSPVAGQVHCVATAAPELEGERDTGRAISWEWWGRSARVRASGVRVDMCALEPGRYAATARVAPGTAGCSSLCTALAAAVLRHAGGLVLHSAAVELDGQAVLFVGPSGAGKTTASSLTRTARWVAADRAAVYPTPWGWYAAPMAAGSDAPALRRAEPRPRPLGAILRVRQGGPPRIERVTSAEALGLLRSATLAPPSGADSEQRLFEDAVAVSNAVFVGVVSTALGEDLTAVVRTALNEGSTAP